MIVWMDQWTWGAEGEGGKPTHLFLSLSPYLQLSFLLFISQVFWGVAQRTGLTVQPPAEGRLRMSACSTLNCQSSGVKIHCRFAVPPVANSSHLQPVCSALFTMHSITKVVADYIIIASDIKMTILLIMMTKKRIILFWMCIFVTALKCFIHHYSL